MSGWVKKLRNGLEEFEEFLDDGGNFSPHEDDEATGVSDCRTLMDGIDMALQQEGDVQGDQTDSGESEVAHLRLSIEQVIQDLSQALRKLQTRSESHAEAETASASLSPSQLYAPPSLETRHMRSETGKSDLNASRDNFKTRWTDSAVAPQLDIHQKTSLAPARSSLSSPSQLLRPYSQSPDWRHLSILDPLSIPIEDASTMILGSYELGVRPIFQIESSTAKDKRGDLEPKGEIERPHSTPGIILESPKVPSTKDASTDPYHPDKVQEQPRSAPPLPPSRAPPPPPTSAPPPVPARISPPVPSRPQFPPPTPRRMKTKLQSKPKGRYRIVNGSSDPESSDDESYPTTAHTSFRVEHADARTIAGASIQFIDPQSADQQSGKGIEEGVASGLIAKRLPPAIRKDSPLEIEKIVVAPLSGSDHSPPCFEMYEAAFRTSERYPRLIVHDGDAKLGFEPDGRKWRQGMHAIDRQEGLEAVSGILAHGAATTPGHSIEDQGLQLDGPGARLALQADDREWRLSLGTDERYDRLRLIRDDQIFLDPGSENGDIDIDSERERYIVGTFNRRSWDLAKIYLIAHLEIVVERGDLATARRINHLLGVCTSLQGRAAQAIPFFIAAMKTPIQDASHLDEGDCAAAYWLADIYATQNRRAEASLAYAIAAYSPLFEDSSQPRLRHYVDAERNACLPAFNLSDNRQFWNKYAFHSRTPIDDSILHAQVVAQPAVQALLTNDPRQSVIAMLNPDLSRSKALVSSYTHAAAPEFYNHCNLISAAMLAPGGAWPMRFDPWFNLAAVARGRFLLSDCNFLTMVHSNADKKIPKRHTLAALSQAEIFMCEDLTWLIENVRRCLETLEMDWEEVERSPGPAFAVRYSFIQNRLSSTHYFSITLFRKSVRSGYGVRICPEGFGSSRLAGKDTDAERRHSEPKRLKEVIREFMEQAARERFSPEEIVL